LKEEEGEKREKKRREKREKDFVWKREEKTLQEGFLFLF